MSQTRDPHANPFADPDRRAIWEMLVPRDIDAFVTADWDAVAGDFADGFWALGAGHQGDPERFALSFPTLAAYRDEWLRQARAFRADMEAGAFAGDPRAGIFAATRLEDIEITGDMAMARKRFDGWLPRTDGTKDRMNWQTLYVCRREGGRWKIAGFMGYLPHIRDTP